MLRRIDYQKIEQLLLHQLSNLWIDFDRYAIINKKRNL